MGNKAPGPLQQVEFSMEIADVHSVNSHENNGTICIKSKGEQSPRKRKGLRAKVIKQAGKGQSISEIARAEGMPSRCTIYRWLECPDYRTRFDEATGSHHLKKSGNRPYQLRVMIDRGPKKVGKRITVPLETHDLEEARIKRDAIISFLRSQGVKLVGHFPKVPKTGR